MLRNVYLTFIFIIVMGCAAIAQTGSIKGKVIDKTTNEPLPFASVVAEMNGTQAGGAQTDFDGNFTIKPLGPGTYTLKASFVGYNPTQVTGVIVSVDKITFADVKLGKGAVDITAVDVVAFKVPLIDKGNPAVQTTITQEDIKAIPTRDVKSVAATAAGVFQKDDGDDVNIRGSRDDATDYYVDGIRVRGSAQLPQSAIEQVTVITGGVPAQYGDATGGIISITTRGPSKTFAGGVEVATSELFDKYGYNLLSANVSGPILSKKDKDGNKTPLIGFFLSGEAELQKDPDPTAIGNYTLKDNVFDDLSKNPYNVKFNEDGRITSFLTRAESLKRDELQNRKYRVNAEQNEYKANASLDFQPTSDINIKIGGSYNYKNNRDRSGDYVTPTGYELLNSDNLTKIYRNAYRGYLRFTQRFGSDSKDEKNASLFKNIFYSVQVDYNKSIVNITSDKHGSDVFKYGYVGKFDEVRTPFFITNPNGQKELVGYTPSVVLFTPGGLNPLVENYTIDYLTSLDPDYFNHVNEYNNSNGAVNNFQNLSGGQFSYSQVNSFGTLAPINGGLAPDVYSMWRNIGYNPVLYLNSNNDQYRAVISGSADIKNHSISLGFEYEQRIDRQYSVGGTPLWSAMRNYANFGLTQANQSAGSITINDTVYHPNTGPENGTPNGFYENVRKKLGLSMNDYVNIDAYGPETYSLNMFTVDELAAIGFMRGNYGYDYKGNLLKVSSPSAAFDKFFTDKDEFGNYKREVPAFQPIYLAGYIQDNFAVNDLIFNVGVRIDRYDANQRVLKDKYLLYEAFTKGEINIDGQPGNIGNDYVVYVSDPEIDVTTMTKDDIIGYRSGETWYDKNGVEISDPAVLQAQSSTSILAPILVNKGTDYQVQGSLFDPKKSFKDYEPQISIMPRVAFQFDINDQAQFFANYSVLTQRPVGNRSNPWNYYYFTNTLTLNNPDLKPEKTTNYELGFRQILSRSSVITISGFYREMRDNIQVQNILFAYPQSYKTYTNIDFGNVKGLTFAYDMRRTGNIRMGASYTLQFADGTGSSTTSAASLIQTGQPNLRVIQPLDFDQRHNLIVSFDYRYEEGKSYNGPVLFGKQILANAGARVEFKAGSGTPYTRQTIATPEANDIGLQTSGNSKVKGDINGARLPWNYRFDLKIDKDFAIKTGKEGKSKYYVNVYLQVQNLLNTKNIISVYRYTGNPDDDGYLGSDQGLIALRQLEASGGDVEAFEQLYSIRANNPDNYSIPRRMRIGASFNF